MSVYLQPRGYVIEQILASLAGSAEYMSWAPQSYWDSLEPGVIEYESWFPHEPQSHEGGK